MPFRKLRVRDGLRLLQTFWLGCKYDTDALQALTFDRFSLFIRRQAQPTPRFVFVGPLRLVLELQNQLVRSVFFGPLRFVIDCRSDSLQALSSNRFAVLRTTTTVTTRTKICLRMHRIAFFLMDSQRRLAPEYLRIAEPSSGS
jgi:hypothetical protein